MYMMIMNFKKLIIKMWLSDKKKEIDSQDIKLLVME